MLFFHCSDLTLSSFLRSLSVLVSDYIHVCPQTQQMRIQNERIVAQNVLISSRILFAIPLGSLLWVHVDGWVVAAGAGLELPVGVQVAGLPYNEECVLRAMSIIETHGDFKDGGFTFVQ
jgi:hypothetical protein